MCACRCRHMGTEARKGGHGDDFLVQTGGGGGPRHSAEPKTKGKARQSKRDKGTAEGDAASDNSTSSDERWFRGAVAATAAARVAGDVDDAATGEADETPAAPSAATVQTTQTSPTAATTSAQSPLAAVAHAYDRLEADEVALEEAEDVPEAQEAQEEQEAAHSAFAATGVEAQVFPKEDVSGPKRELESKSLQVTASDVAFPKLKKRSSVVRAKKSSDDDESRGFLARMASGVKASFGRKSDDATPRNAPASAPPVSSFTPVSSGLSKPSAAAAPAPSPGRVMARKTPPVPAAKHGSSTGGVAKEAQPSAAALAGAPRPGAAAAAASLPAAVSLPVIASRSVAGVAPAAAAGSAPARGLSPPGFPLAPPAVYDSLPTLASAVPPKPVVQSLPPPPGYGAFPPPSQFPPPAEASSSSASSLYRAFTPDRKVWTAMVSTVNFGVYVARQ